MLYRLQTNALIVGLLTIGFLAVVFSDRAFCLMTVGTIVAFISQVVLILLFSQGKDTAYTDKGLFWSVLLYGLVCGIWFMSISYYYDGDTFMLSKTDAMFYYRNSIKVVDIGFWENAKRLFKTFDFDDCGALVFDSLVLSIIPDKLFLNSINIFTGAISSVMLFRIGQHYLPNSYAFCAGLAYATSSYLIFFHCSFLKESNFVFLIISSTYFFYNAFIDENQLAFVGMIISLVLSVFYRPAVVAFMIISFAIYFAIKLRGTAISMFLYGLIGVSLVVTMSFMQGMVDTYTGGDMDALIEYSAASNYSSGFSYFVSYFISFFGPFPTLFPKNEFHPGLLNFYAAGLVYRAFLAIPFWVGVYFIIKRSEIQLTPIVAFILIEMVSTAIIMASMELRKLLLHMPFMYIISAYGLYHWHIQKRLSMLPESAIYIFAVLILSIWTLRGV